VQKRYWRVLAPVGGVLALALLVGLAVQREAAAQPAGCQTFPETGQTVCGKFLTYWRTHGGLAQQGYPLTGEFSEVSDLDGKPYTVQYFERAVFEAHPEYAPPYDVLLAQLGTYQLKRKYPGGTPGATPPAGDAWAALRARPVKVPTTAPGSRCPITPAKIVSPDFAPALGDGPVYPVGLYEGVLAYINEPSLFPAPWGGQKVLWIAAPSYKGPILIRGHQVNGPNELRFVAGAAPPDELRLHTDTGGALPSGWSNWPTYTRVRTPGCYAYQIDGTNFTSFVIFQAVIGGVPSP
jgi:hypothetical protein